MWYRNVTQWCRNLLSMVCEQDKPGEMSHLLSYFVESIIRGYHFYKEIIWRCLEVSVGFFPSAELDRSSTGFTSLLAALIVETSAAVDSRPSRF